MITTHALSILVLALTIAFLIVLASHVSHDLAMRRTSARIDELEKTLTRLCDAEGR